MKIQMNMQRKILVVDDEVSILRSIEAYLEDLSYRVFTASDGKEGLSRYCEHSPDLILLNLNIPGKTGVELIREIRRFSQHTPIIVISGTGNINEAIDTIRIGAWDFLSKPLYDFRLLEHAIDKAFEKAKLIQENEKYQQNLETQIISHSEKLVKTNEALKISEEKYRSYVEESPDGIIAINERGKIVDANRSFLALTGFTKEELLEEDERITPAVAKKKWGHLHTLMHQSTLNGEAGGELKFIRKDEQLVWLGFTATRLPGGGLLGFFRDITLEKNAQKAAIKHQEIQQMQRDLAAWLSVCPDIPTAAADVLGQLTWLDEVDCGSLLILTKDAHLELIAQSNVSSDFWNKISDHTIEYIETNLERYTEPRQITGDGIREYMGEPAYEAGIQCAGIYPLKYDGETEAVICVASKSVSAFSETTNDVIESVAALTSVAISRLIAEQELRSAIQHAKEANRLKSRFVSNVSHELRTPLNGIIGFSEFIMAAKTLDEAQDNARTIIREGEVLLRLVNGLLDHAKMEEGKLELNPEIIDLHSLLDDIARTSFLQAHRKGLDFDLKLGSGLPKYIEADGLRLRQILNNLTSNSLKFTEKGVIHIIAEVQKQEDSVSTIRFAVKDTGIGIPKSRQKAIFDSFVQADSGTARKYGGSGLGTTISLQLVKIMGGTMGLESEEGQGSEFWFTVSFPTLALADAEARIKSSLVQMLRPIDVAAGKILLAEDYEINQKVIGHHLSQEGFHYKVVENGKDAVDACESELFSLILMDVNMPEMDGIEATGIIRSQSSRNRNTPILALTASAEPETREACLNTGMNDVITKPVKREVFIGAVYKWFTPITIDENGIPIVQPSARISKADFREAAHVNDPSAEADATEAADDNVQSQPPLLDISTLLEQFGGNVTLAQTMVNHFKKTVPNQLNQMAQALKSNDLESVRKEAHKIKGGAGSIAAFMLMDIARRLEDAAREGVAQDATFLLKELSSSYEQFKAVQLS
ncbi:MAG: response regulator [Deltaproteobacteria bacterium]|nr:response regulator [Deltaproteobacteria bacterium]